jgi:hypothetical protein
MVHLQHLEKSFVDEHAAVVAGAAATVKSLSHRQ